MKRRGFESALISHPAKNIYPSVASKRLRTTAVDKTTTHLSMSTACFVSQNTRYFRPWSSLHNWSQ